MKETFVNHRFGPAQLQMVKACNDIVRNYQAQNLRLTLRQLYYQLVTQNIITNEEKSYKNLGKLLSNARLAGLVDWEAIEDRVRVPRMPQQFDDLGDLVTTALSAYRLPRWNGQDVYAELWVEKDALSGVLAPLAREFHVPLLVNRGYSSQSAMYDSSKRFIDNAKRGKSILFYLGDHDPSGEDMVRDIQDRLDMFGAEVSVEKLALTMKQVQQYNPPPNPAKHTDSRYAKYAAEHGNQSWEVDALSPDVLNRLIRTAFRQVIDMEKMDAILEQEKKDKVLLQAAVASLQKGKK